jgi:hypothetical protein
MGQSTKSLSDSPLTRGLTRAQGNQRRAALAADLVRRQVAVIVADGSALPGSCCKGGDLDDPNRVFDQRGPDRNQFAHASLSSATVDRTQYRLRL